MTKEREELVKAVCTASEAIGALAELHSIQMREARARHRIACRNLEDYDKARQRARKLEG